MLREEILERVNRYLINETEFLKVKDKLSEDQLKEFISQAICDLSDEHSLDITVEQRLLLVQNLASAVVSLGPIRPLMEDVDITEIMINGSDKIYIQKGGRITLTDIKFDDNQHLMHTIQKTLAVSGSNKRVDESSPYVDFSLTDGSRVNVILPPCSLVGPVMTIRKFKDDITTDKDLIRLKMVNEDIALLLIKAMEAKLNIVFCGATGAGKTTALNVFSHYIPSEERIVTIEDTPELRLRQEHVVTLSTKPANIEGKGAISIKELFINSLRMRPDRIIIGEIRGGEMLDLIQSISSGHSGSLAIVHAETPKDCFNRMVTMMLMTGIRLSTPEIQKQVAQAIDLIVHVELQTDGRRRVTNVTDCYHHDMTGKIIMNDIFKFEDEGIDENGLIIGKWDMNKRRPSFMHKFIKRRIELPNGFFDD